ncbi:MAG: inositol monophosphatase family protein [Bacteriovoracaceae bacterium]
MMNYNKCLKQVSSIAYLAGEGLKKRAKGLRSLKISTKEAQGLVSKADIESEELIRKLLLNNFPEHEFLGEEGSYKSFGSSRSAMKKFGDIPWCWVVDPLDGTTNYLNQFGYYAVCIGLLHYGEPTLGLVYRPETAECFFATKSKGAFKGILTNKGIGKKKKLDPYKKSKLKDCLLVTGFSSEKGKIYKREFKKFNDMLSKARGVRRLGSAALDMCYVAEGIFDGFWEAGLAPWDVSASSIICMESNLQVSNYKGETFNPFDKSILVASGKIHRQMKNVLLT